MGGQTLRQDVDLKVLLIYYTEQETFEKGTGRNSCPNPISQITIVQAESDNNEIMPVVTRVMYLPPPGPEATFKVQVSEPHLSHITLGNEKLPT